MKAFVEHLCEHCCIVRAGPNTEKYGDPWDYAVTVLIRGRTGIIKALASDGKMTVAHAKAAFNALKQIGLSATWERIK